MEEEPLLSICIPTYNSFEYLSETLDNIVCQFKNKDVFHKTEIVISDNNSPDKTFETIQKYQKMYSNIHYFKNETNLGSAVNIIKVTEHAHWKYLWLLTDNDSPSHFALKYILRIISETNFDLMLWEFIEGKWETIKEFHEDYRWYNKFYGIGEFSVFFWEKKQINLHKFGSNFSLYSIFFIKKDYFNYSRSLIDKNKLKNHYFPHALIAFSHIEDKIIIKPNNSFIVGMWHYSTSRNHCKKIMDDFKEVFSSFMWSKKITKKFRFKVKIFLFRYWIINFISSSLNYFPSIKKYLRDASLSKSNILWRILNLIINPSI